MSLTYIGFNEINIGYLPWVVDGCVGIGAV